MIYCQHISPTFRLFSTLQHTFTLVPRRRTLTRSTSCLFKQLPIQAKYLSSCTPLSVWPSISLRPNQKRSTTYRSLSSTSNKATKLQAVLGEADEMDAYAFPDARLKKKMNDPSKTPLLLVACGSFSPITFLHLRMFVMADDYTKHNTQYEVVGGYLSPVSDAYKKQGLAVAEHRRVPGPSHKIVYTNK